MLIAPRSQGLTNAHPPTKKGGAQGNTDSPATSSDSPKNQEKLRRIKNLIAKLEWEKDHAADLALWEKLQAEQKEYAKRGALRAQVESVVATHNAHKKLDEIRELMEEMKRGTTKQANDHGTLGGAHSGEALFDEMDLCAENVVQTPNRHSSSGWVNSWGGTRQSMSPIQNEWEPMASFSSTVDCNFGPINAVTETPKTVKKVDSAQPTPAKNTPGTPSTIVQDNVTEVSSVDKRSVAEASFDVDAFTPTQAEWTRPCEADTSDSESTVRLGSEIGIQDAAVTSAVENEVAHEDVFVLASAPSNVTPLPAIDQSPVISQGVKGSVNADACMAPAEEGIATDYLEKQEVSGHSSVPFVAEDWADKTWNTTEVKEPVVKAANEDTIATSSNREELHSPDANDSPALYEADSPESPVDGEKTLSHNHWCLDSVLGIPHDKIPNAGVVDNGVKQAAYMYAMHGPLQVTVLSLELEVSSQSTLAKEASAHALPDEHNPAAYLVDETSAPPADKPKTEAQANEAKLQLVEDLEKEGDSSTVIDASAAMDVTQAYEDDDNASPKIVPLDAFQTNTIPNVSAIPNIEQAIAAETTVMFGGNDAKSNGANLVENALPTPVVNPNPVEQMNIPPTNTEPPTQVISETGQITDLPEKQMSEKEISEDWDHPFGSHGKSLQKTKEVSDTVDAKNSPEKEVPETMEGQSADTASTSDTVAHGQDDSGDISDPPTKETVIAGAEKGEQKEALASVAESHEPTTVPASTSNEREGDHPLNALKPETETPDPIAKVQAKIKAITRRHRLEAAIKLTEAAELREAAAVQLVGLADEGDNVVAELNRVRAGVAAEAGQQLTGTTATGSSSSPDQHTAYTNSLLTLLQFVEDGTLTLDDVKEALEAARVRGYGPH